MKSRGRSMQLASQIGEYLVAAELGRRNFIATTFTQNIPEFDILAIDEGLKRTIPIQVKTKRKGGAWQSTVDKWMNIEMDGECQIIKSKTKLRNPDLIYIYVELGSHRIEDRFFILKHKDVQNIFYTNHKNWLHAHGGRRPKKPDSMHCAISTKDLEPYKDNWIILSQSQTLQTD